MAQTVSIFSSVQNRLLIDCVVGLPDDINPIRDRNSVICHGLVDTGAMASAVSSRVADFGPSDIFRGWCNLRLTTKTVASLVHN